jgi:hypothetical protein
MPALTRDTLTINAFEDRMRLRCRMFSRNGVSLAALHATGDLADTARRTVETCLACTSDDACGRWVEAGPAHTGIPQFCHNMTLIEALRNDARIRLEDT